MEEAEDEAVFVSSHELEMECSFGVGQCLYDMRVYYEPEEGVSVVTGSFIGADLKEDTTGFLADLTPNEINTYESMVGQHEVG